LTAAGIFGPRTFDAVTTFQRIFGLTPDGVVGPITWGRLAQECPSGGSGGGDGGSGGGGSSGAMPGYPGTPLRTGSRGDSVRQIQHCLNHVSQPCSRQLAEDGNFGPLTHAAVVNFQRMFELNPDGVVGPLTWARLAQECGSGRTAMAFGHSHDDSRDACTGCIENAQSSGLESNQESGNGDIINFLLPLLLIRKLSAR